MGFLFIVTLVCYESGTVQSYDISMRSLTITEVLENKKEV